MASISNDPNGRRRIQFVAANGKRKAIRLGKVPLRHAEEVLRHVEALVASEASRMPIDLATARWLGEIGDELVAKLARVGLVAKRSSNALEAFLDSYITTRTDLKPRTIENLTICKARLVEFFGADKPLREITAGDAERWFLWMKEKGTKGKRQDVQYADGTVGRTVKRAQQFFAHAVRDRLLAENPFAQLKPPSDVNEKRKAYVDVAATAAVLEACPDTEWRLIVALSRFGGLRCPSETLTLQLADVDWSQERFLVRSPKTGDRWVPIFPDLRPHLQAAWDQAEDGAVHFINRYRDANQNLRTTMLRIIRKAGLKPWPKPFHNLRASCENDLMKLHAVHLVCSWIGHSALIAQKHYLKATSEDFHRAAGAESGAQAAQNQAQHTAAHRRTMGQENEKPLKNQGLVPAVLGGASGCEVESSPSRTRTYNLAVNSRSLYH